MKRSNIWQMAVLCVCTVLLLLCAGCNNNQPKFHDVTIELGTTALGLKDFLTEHAKPGKASFVTDVTQVDLGVAADTPIILSYDGKEETVMLRVQDTTPPTVEFNTHRTEGINYTPVPEDFIISISDLSETTVSFKEAFILPEVYTDLELTVVVSDAHGNQVEQVCTVTYTWMRSSVDLELGTLLTKEHILMDAEKDADLIDQSKLDEINQAGAGTYTVTATSGESTLSCTVRIQDTKGPDLKLRNVSIYPGETVTMDHFIVSVWDASGDAKLELLTPINLNTTGTQTIRIKATDPLGLETVKEASLAIYPDSAPPVFKGLNAMSIQKHSKPDYRVGVSAYDAKDGACSFTYDASQVDLTKAGTYTVTYTASDLSGNTATQKRTVTVNPDYEDTLALVAQIAQSIPGKDPESLRDYVRNNIRYSSNWGGNDPTWFGFTKFHGNCYVHAYTLKALLDYYGYSSKLIWLEPKYNPHYWVIVNIGGTWYHIDGTPTPQHSKISLMTNEQRLATLGGRKWDVTLWPELYPQPKPEPDEPDEPSTPPESTESPETTPPTETQEETTQPTTTETVEP